MSEPRVWKLLIDVDEWQHGRMPNGGTHPVLSTIWVYAWKPFCDLVDWHYRRPFTSASHESPLVSPESDVNPADDQPAPTNDRKAQKP